MLKQIALGVVLLAGLLDGMAWAGLVSSEGVDKATVEALIAKGEDVVNAKDKNGNTLLQKAAIFGKWDVVELLIAKGADVNAKVNGGATLLHLAASSGKKDVVELLIAKGANVNAKDDTSGKRDNNDMPLHWAVENGKKDVVEVLLAAGSNPDARNHNNKTPLQMTENIQDAKTKQEIIDILTKQPNPRQLLKRLLGQFTDHSDNETLRKSIIDLALKLKPSPAIPPDAEAAAGRAAYIFKNAKSNDDTLNAAKEYLKAIEVAPWVANYYYNLCTVLEKTPYTQQTLHACKLYLTAAPHAADAADMQQRIAGLQYAVDKNKEQMKQRADHYDRSGMYRMGGLSGQVSGKDMGLKLTVDWQAAPPRYQVMRACIQADWIDTLVSDLTSTDTWDRNCEPFVSMHLIIKPDGAGFVELGDANTGSIRTTLDELFKLRRKALEESEIFSRDGKTYVAILQGGKNKQVAGYAMYESDCTGNPRRQDARALPDDFVTLEMKESGKSPYSYSSYGSSCASQFASKTGYGFGGME